MADVPVRWDDFRFVLAIRQAGSLGGAARMLEVEQSTASRRLSALETELGVQLVSRTPEGIKLNEAGLAAAELAETFERGIEHLVGRIGGEDLRPEGIVRLATTDSTAGLLMSGLVPLRDAHPRIRVELVVSNSAHDLLRGEADLAVRLFRETSPTLMVRKLCDIGWSLYASPAYVARAPIAFAGELAPGALTGHAVICYNEELARAPGGAWVAAHSRLEDVVLRVGSVSAAVNAAKSGMGIAVLPCFAVHGMPALVRLTPAVVAQGEAFVVLPPQHKGTTRVRLVMEAVIALFAAERAMIAGTACAAAPA